MTTLLAIDGSLRCVGLAYFVNGVLSDTHAIRWAPRSVKVDPATRAHTLALEAYDALGAAADVVAYEWPQAYGDDKNPNDLFGLVAMSAALASLVEAKAVVSYLPRIWTGGIPKAKKGNPHESPRAAKIRARLSITKHFGRESEAEAFDRCQTHDEIDAVGIGLHHLQRGITVKRRVIARE